MTGYRVEIRPEQHCGIVWLNGPNAVENLMQSTGDVATHPDWSVDFDIIVVVGPDSDLNDVTLERLVAYQAFISEWSSRHRTGPNSRAATVCADEMKRVIVELWLAVNRLATGVEDGIYTTLDAALAGLTRPDDG
ncbi:hypothetical protein [Maricaulis sp.]|uniref:hypothetical protein n=1 Tax=Maricaulis sp. TaxID=1486257 RepID=UPI003A8F3072